MSVTSGIFNRENEKSHVICWMAVECESTEYMHESLLALAYAESVPANT